VESANFGIEIIDNVIDSMSKGTNIQKTVIENVKTAISKVDSLMREVEAKLVSLAADIGVINSEKIEITREAIGTYQNVKSTLRITRNELKRLADKTIRMTKELITYMDAWDSSYSAEDQKEYLKEQVTIMQQLLIESKEILEDAKTKYDNAAKDIDIVNNKLQSFKQNIDQMLDANSAEHKAWTTEIRAGVYAAAGAVTAGMIVADIFGCFGACSASVTTSTWLVSVATVEAKIAEVTAKIEQMEETTQDAIENIDSISEQTKGIQVFIQEETLVIIKWQNSVENTTKNIAKVQQESFYRLNLKRQVFTNSLKGLRDAAQEFWDRPDGIFGEEILEAKLNDPMERQKNLEAERNVKEKRLQLE
jgi:tetrahydromethanopterin S-methyltransferase subunit B